MDDDPKCDKCGAPITTGLMAVFCPFADQCELEREFLEELRSQNPLTAPRVG